MAALQDIFAYRNISEGIERVKTGVPNPLKAVPEFENVTEEVFGNETTYATDYGDRRIVQRVEYGAGSRARSQKKVGAQSIIMPSFAEHILIEQELLLRLRNQNDLMAAEKAQKRIAKFLKDQKTRFENNAITHTVQMLSKGAYWYDASGNLLQSSSGAVDTVDFGIPSGNKTDIGGRIDVSWANAAANIFQHIELFKKKQGQDTGREIEYCFYGINIPKYIYLNTSMKQYFQFNPIYFQAFSQNSGAIPDGFMGIRKWIPMRDTFFENDAESKTQMWSDDLAVFAPAIDNNVYTRFKGSTLAPTNMGVQTGSQTSIDTGELVYGMGGYSIFLADPVAVKVVMFDCGVPVWKNPLDLLQATVAF